MRLDADAKPCKPVHPIGPLRREAPIWEPAIARLMVSGVRCEHCATRIKNALMVSPHVLGADIDPRTGRVEVLFDTVELSLNQIAGMIVAAAARSPRNYTVSDVSVT